VPADSGEITFEGGPFLLTKATVHTTSKVEYFVKYKRDTVDQFWNYKWTASPDMVRVHHSFVPKMDAPPPPPPTAELRAFEYTTVETTPTEVKFRLYVDYTSVPADSGEITFEGGPFLLTKATVHTTSKVEYFVKYKRDTVRHDWGYCWNAPPNLTRCHSSYVPPVDP
jgi:hypothetical protein